MGHVFSDFGKVAVSFFAQCMTFQVSNNPVTFFELFLIQPFFRTGFQYLFQYRMIRHHKQAVFNDFNTCDKAAQKRSDQRFRFCLLFAIFGTNNSDDAITMHYPFHLLRRDEIAFSAMIGFQKAETTI